MQHWVIPAEAISRAAAWMLSIEGAGLSCWLRAVMKSAGTGSTAPFIPPDWVLVSDSIVPGTISAEQLSQWDISIYLSFMTSQASNYGIKGSDFSGILSGNLSTSFNSSRMRLQFFIHFAGQEGFWWGFCTSLWASKEIRCNCSIASRQHLGSTHCEITICKSLEYFQVTVWYAMAE